MEGDASFAAALPSAACADALCAYVAESAASGTLADKEAAAHDAALVHRLQGCGLCAAATRTALAWTAVSTLPAGGGGGATGEPHTVRGGAAVTPACATQPAPQPTAADLLASSALPAAEVAAGTALARTATFMACIVPDVWCATGRMGVGVDMRREVVAKFTDGAMLRDAVAAARVVARAVAEERRGRDRVAAAMAAVPAPVAATLRKTLVDRRARTAEGAPVPSILALLERTQAAFVTTCSRATIAMDAMLAVAAVTRALPGGRTPDDIGTTREPGAGGGAAAADGGAAPAPGTAAAWSAPRGPQSKVPWPVPGGRGRRRQLAAWAGTGRGGGTGVVAASGGTSRNDRRAAQLAAGFDATHVAAVLRSAASELRGCDVAAAEASFAVAVRWLHAAAKDLLQLTTRAYALPDAARMERGHAPVAALALPGSFARARAECVEVWSGAACRLGVEHVAGSALTPDAASHAAGGGGLGRSDRWW